MTSGERFCGARSQFSVPLRSGKMGVNSPDSSTVLTSLAEEEPELLELVGKSVASSHLC